MEAAAQAEKLNIRISRRDVYRAKERTDRVCLRGTEEGGQKGEGRC